MLDNVRQEMIISMCQQLIQTKSYSGQEKDIVDLIKKLFHELDFDDYFTDRYGNIIGHIKGNEEGKSVLFDSHMDTVEVSNPDLWTHDPFKGEIQDKKIWGRGASDMKGSLAAMIGAAAFFAKDNKKDFKGDIYVAGVVHEECFEGVAAREISKTINPDYVVIGEASNLNLKIGQKGRAEIIIETFGKTAHSARPEKGNNAVYHMTRLIEEIRKLKTTKHSILGPGILELTDIKSSPYPGSSVIPDYCRATYDRRLLTGETKEDVLQSINEIIENMRKEPGFEAKTSFAVAEEDCYTGEKIRGERFFPAWLFNEDEKFIQSILDQLRKADLNSNISYYSFCTNGSHYAGEKNIKTIGFGPSQENIAHTVDEYIEIEQLLNAAKGYYAISNCLLK